jgi:hypothetical protein
MSSDGGRTLACTGLNLVEFLDKCLLLGLLEGVLFGLVFHEVYYIRPSII